MHIFRILLLISLLACPAMASAFTVVLDAGHGGQDAGAVGATSKEKNINLRHVLLVGDMLQEQCPGIRIIYTRDKDVFVDLNERARIANRAKADLFVSIHTNAARNRSAEGMETFTLGVSRTKENMEVAMLENSVILLEDDYQNKYQGFDPNSTDSYIMFEFMKDRYMENSITCADLIQTGMVNAVNRTDRGVRQAGFLVLRATTMPSVLIELGFISNREEEKSLNNNQQQIAVSSAICKAILDYKHQLEKKSGKSNSDTTPTPPATPISTIIDSAKTAPAAPVTTDSISSNELWYGLQILVSKNHYQTNDPVFKGVSGIRCIEDNGIYKYIAACSANQIEVNQAKTNVTAKFPDAFVVAYKGNQRVKLP